MSKRTTALIVTVLLAAIVIGVMVSLNTRTAFADTPPEPEPPAPWDKSSVVVDAACVEGVPTFDILNHGAIMTGPTPWYTLNVDGGASTCADDVAAGYISTGVVQLAADESATLTFDPTVPPLRLCVQQRPGHPGTGWASATITADIVAACVTAEDVADEPGRLRWLFVPWVTGE